MSKIGTYIVFHIHNFWLQSKLLMHSSTVINYACKKKNSMVKLLTII